MCHSLRFFTRLNKTIGHIVVMWLLYDVRSIHMWVRLTSSWHTQNNEKYHVFFTMESPQSNEDIAKQIILKEINNVSANSLIIKENGCSACHILFNLMDNMQISESDASDLLSQVVSDDPKLNDRFIEMVEKIHMKERMMGIPFSIKTREAKDKYIASNFKNLLRLSYRMILLIMEQISFFVNYWRPASHCN